MKYEVEGTPVVSSGATDEFEFEIAQNEVAFDAWSSKLYTRKERAIVRELSCNAWDAHVMAGKADVPFEIHLPTTHEPWFSINDFGTGMTHEEMKLLFSLYFGSNKRGNNHTIGALGLGSKSPFCYKGNGGTYSVISRKDGITRMYVASKRNGKPHMEMLGTPIQTPDAPNGIEIKFAVDPSDNWTWENEAKVALEFINPAPKVNIKGFEPTRFSYELRHEKWGLRKEAHTAFGYSTRAIMGNVQYQIGDIDRSLVKHSYQSKILSMPIDMFFPLGALDFSLSREALEMTPKTINAILGTADFIFDNFLQQVKSQIDACQHAWEANILLYSLINSTTGPSVQGGSAMGGLIYEAMNAGKLWGKYKNFTLTNSKIKVNELAYNNVDLILFERNDRAQYRSKKKDVFTTETEMSRNQMRSKAKLDEAVARSFKYEIKTDSSVLFVIDDTKRKSNNAIHQLLMAKKDSEYRYVYLVRRLHKDVPLDKVVAEGKKMLADLGHPPFKLLSELEVQFPPAIKVRTTGVARERRELVVFFRPSGHGASTGWKKAWRSATEEEFTQPKKFYVALEKLVAADTKFADAWEFEKFIINVAQSGKFGIDPTTPIFGIKHGSKLLKNNTGEFVELMSYVFTKVKKIMTPEKTKAMSLYLNPFSDHEYLDLFHYLVVNQPLSDSPFQNFACALEEAREYKERNWKEFQGVLNVYVNRGKLVIGQTVDFSKQWESVKALYPMLALVGGYSFRLSRNNMHTVIEYIKMVDEQNKREALAKAAASNT